MKAYSEDLRTKILEAVDRGMPKSEAARAFGVRRPSVKRYAAARREGRPLAPRKHPGSKPQLDESARKLLEADVEIRPAITLKDRCRFLEEMVGSRLASSPSRTEAGADSGDGQPLGPQGSSGQGADRGQRLRAPPPTALLAGPQPHRRSVRQAQGAAEEGRGAYPRGAHRSDGPELSTR